LNLAFSNKHCLCVLNHPDEKAACQEQSPVLAAKGMHPLMLRSIQGHQILARAGRELQFFTFKGLIPVML